MKTLAPPAPAPAPVSSSSSAAAPSSILLRKPRLSPNNCYTIFTLFAFVIFLTVLYSEDFSCIFSQVLDNSSSSFSSSFSSAHGKYSILTRTSRGSAAAATRAGGGDHELKPQKKRRPPVNLPFSLASAGGGGGCDVFSGKWVLDEANRPLYEEWECPYIQPQLTCQEHGRPDKDYQRWRWQPHSCSLPSFNASLMLETLRGKRMMFVGDSLNRGQYISMVCLLHRIIPEDAKSMETNGSLTIFRAKEYNASIEFYWAPFLLESNSDDAVVHRISDRVVRRGSINKHGRHWKGVDIMVFNTYLWWMTGLKFKILQGGSFEDQVKDIVEVSTEDAYRMGMKSMLRWVKKNMDPSKTRVFFTSMSPSHQKSIDWGAEPNGNCYNETGMIEDAEYWGSDCRRSIMRVIDQVLSKSEVPITFLNITQLSNYRKDAHTSIYKKQWSPLSPQQLANPASYADCVHWCLPGLQDTWNELLFTKLFYA